MWKTLIVSRQEKWTDIALYSVGNLSEELKRIALTTLQERDVLERTKIKLFLWMCS
jgi:hypothetical protein